MKLVGELRNPEIVCYYATGCLEERVENKVLQTMLQQIKEKAQVPYDLWNHYQGMITSFTEQGYLTDQGEVSGDGMEIIDSGKEWKRICGAFFLTVLNYEDKQYLLDAELVNNEDEGMIDFSRASEETDAVLNLSGEYGEAAYGIRYRISSSDFNKYVKRVSVISEEKVRFEYDFEKSECRIETSYYDNKFRQNKKCVFITRQNSSFTIIDQHEANFRLEQEANEFHCFRFDPDNPQRLQITVSDDLTEDTKKMLLNFFEKGTVDFPDSEYDDETVIRIENVPLTIADSQEGTKTAIRLLHDYLLAESYQRYLNDSEIAHLVRRFEALFIFCPIIEKSTQDLCKELLEKAKKQEDKTAYLRLQACQDLSPGKIFDSYTNTSVSFVDKPVSFEQIVQELWGLERDVVKISVMSKYIRSAKWNAQAFQLFAEAIQKIYGIRLTLITTQEVINENPRFSEENRRCYETLRKSRSIDLIETNREFLMHNRYYRIERQSGKVEWWLCHLELENLRFDKSVSKPTPSTPGRSMELIFSRIDQAGIPENVVKLMEENK